MTALARTRPQPDIAPNDLQWNDLIELEWTDGQYLIPITNFAGRNYPSLSDKLMTSLLAIKPTDRVIDVGGGDASFSRANVVTDAFPDDGIHRSGRAAEDNKGRRKIVQCFAEDLPFEDKEFDFAYCRAVLEHVIDPTAACTELMRVAKRGFIETPSPLSEYFGGHPTHRWLTWLEADPDGGTPTLVFKRKPFLRAPFRYCMRGQWFAMGEYQRTVEWTYRNLVCTQLQWEGEFKFRVEPDAGIDYDDPLQAGELHLDAAVNGLRWGGVPTSIIMADAERACELTPENPIAHNAYGCALWQDGRREKALSEFAKAAQIEPENTTFRQNARLSVRDENAQLNLALMPPTVEDTTDIESNFAGKVFYAHTGYDDRLAADIGVKEGDRVLDVGGGQRPLKRADVSIDFDVFEGVHRQGLTISREKPLVCGDVQSLPFTSKSFDVVCCRMVLEHVIDPASALRELQRVGKRGFIETPNVLWESFYGHPTHRWLISFEAKTNTVVFQRKPFDRIPFACGIVPYLYTNAEVQRAFEVSYRNLTTVQATWDENTPLNVRVEDDENCPYDYLGSPEDATRGSMNYARDLMGGGLAMVAVAEAEDAIRNAPTPPLYDAALRLRLEIARLLGDSAKVAEVQQRLRRGFAVVSGGLLEQKESAPITDNSLPIVWNAPLLDPSGYADEARHFLFALASQDANGLAPASREIRWSEKIAPLPPDRKRILQAALARPAPLKPLSIWHILAPHFQNDPLSRANVGRTMFETDRLPEGWAAACNRMDAVWVPGEFNRETFARAGVERDKLRIVPGAIDLSPYRRDLKPLSIDGANGYSFLSLFDWTLRKGWDVLIKAYVEEFRTDEDVTLILKTHSSMGYTTDQIFAQVSDYLTKTLNLDPETCPDIIFQDAALSDAQMPHLYRAADCYVSPTRGEGWGRPLMEAMAMALPVIATNWSGQTAFLNEENSLLLDYTLVEVSETAAIETPTYRGHFWAEPSVGHLRQLMRRAFSDRNTLLELGEKGRAHLKANFTYPHVTRILEAEIKRLL